MSSQDLLKLSAATAKLYTPGGLSELPLRILAVAREVLDCDHLSYNEFGEGHFVAVLNPTISSELGASFQRLASGHPSLVYLQEKGTEEVVKISDFLSDRQWMKTELYNEFFRKLDIRYQLAFLFKQGNIQIGFASNRRDKDFSERDRLLLSYLLPHLRQAYENAAVYDRMQRSMDQRGYGTVVLNSSGQILYCSPRAQESIERFYGHMDGARLPAEIVSWARQAMASSGVESYSSASFLPLKKRLEKAQLTLRISPNHATREYTLTTDEQGVSIPLNAFKTHGLSAREAEVLSWIVQGKTNPEIGIILSISTKTVAHHVERILAKIGVEGRGGAGAWAQEILLSERMNYAPFYQRRKVVQSR